ncbi:MAG: X-Pro dipeptidyl-peptidase [Thiotrichales bacterium]|nr:X-Pro dipeptidyl-peptidase [Thiotrichales bacterium]
MTETVEIPGLKMELDIGVPMSDGTVLATDVYRPVGQEPAPALLLRTPYDKRDVESQAYAHPAWYVAKGFAVVSQDVRGRWLSEGEFEPFANEANDGAETIEWIARQPWCDGSVGMFGFSYPGATQMLAALESQTLKAMVPAMTGSSYCDGWTYRNGVLKLSFILTWVAGLGRDQALRAGDVQAADEFDALLADAPEFHATLPLREAVPAHLLRYVPYLHDWLSHRDYDDYWRAHSPMERYSDISAPALHIAGWYDLFLEPTLDNYAALAAQGRAPQMLLVGPWVHMPWVRQVGEFDFGEAAASTIDELQCRFFERWLRGIENGLDAEPAVRLFVLGSNRWLYSPSWPPPSHETNTFYLHSDGRAASLNGTGQLTRERPQHSRTVDGFPANPHAPVASLGGRGADNPAVAPAGAADQRPEEFRNDVLVFSSEPLHEPLTLAGYPEVCLHVAANVPSADFVVRLVDVSADGRAIGLCDAIERVEVASGAVVELKLRLSPIANCFQVGHRIRLEVTGSDFPTHERNPHCPMEPFDARATDFRVASQFVFHGGEYLSRLSLPILDESIE